MTAHEHTLFCSRCKPYISTCFSFDDIAACGSGLGVDDAAGSTLLVLVKCCVLLGPIIDLWRWWPHWVEQSWAGACCPVRVIARLLLGSHQPPATQQKGYESWRVVACGCHHQNTDSSPGNIMGEGQWDIGRGQEEGGAVL